MPMEKSSQYYEKALRLAEEPQCDFEAAHPYLMKAHEAGSGEASYAMGNWYFYGRYMSQDIKKAVEFWEFAANRDNIDGLTELAKFYENEKFVKQDMSKALGYWMKAALLGDAESMHEVGRIYYYGIGVEEDRDISDIWLGAAERNGYVETEFDEE